MKDILKEQLKNIQLEYKKLLVDIKPYIDDNIASVVDEINMFWLQHKKLILFALERMSSKVCKLFCLKLNFHTSALRVGT